MSVSSSLTWLPGMNYSIECNLIFLNFVKNMILCYSKSPLRTLLSAFFFSYDSLRKQLTISPSSDWNKLRDVIKYKIEEVVTQSYNLKFRVLIYFFSRTSHSSYQHPKNPHHLRHISLVILLQVVSNCLLFCREKSLKII